MKGALHTTLNGRASQHQHDTNTGLNFVTQRPRPAASHFGYQFCLGAKRLHQFLTSPTLDPSLLLVPIQGLSKTKCTNCRFFRAGVLSFSDRLPYHIASRSCPSRKSWWWAKEKFPRVLFGGRRNSYAKVLVRAGCVLDAPPTYFFL